MTESFNMSVVKFCFVFSIFCLLLFPAHCLVTILLLGNSRKFKTYLLSHALLVYYVLCCNYRLVFGIVLSVRIM